VLVRIFQDPFIDAATESGTGLVNSSVGNGVCLTQDIVNGTVRGCTGNEPNFEGSSRLPFPFRPFGQCWGDGFYGTTGGEASDGNGLTMTYEFRRFFGS
jgi:hypothetical protein